MSELVVRPPPGAFFSLRNYTEALLDGGAPLPADGLAPQVRERLAERPVGYPRLAVYVGRGASHSWLWLAGCLYRLGFYDVRLLSEENVGRGLRDTDVALFPGGDTFGMAEALGPEGLGGLAEFVERGGAYVGVCAGAYLPMRSSKPSLSQLNLVRVRVANLARTVPPAQRLAHKFTQPYGCDLVFHAARGPLVMDGLGGPLAYARSIVAPIYGGPPMRPDGEAETYASFAGFTPRTEFLVDEAFARRTFDGQALAVGARHGRGAVYLYSAHFEHPDYPEANIAVANTVFHAQRARGHSPREPPFCIGPDQARTLARELHGAASNLRVAAAGLESAQVFWQIGQKVWEPEKARYFAEAAYECARELRAAADDGMPIGEPEQLRAAARDALGAVQELRRCLRGGGDSLSPAREAFSALNRFAVQLYSARFAAKLERVINDKYRKLGPKKASQYA